MKKEYKKPLAEVIEFVPEDDIMDDIDLGDDDDWFGGDGNGASGSIDEW